LLNRMWAAAPQLELFAKYFISNTSKIETLIIADK
jgi:hypothetical protein